MFFVVIYLREAKVHIIAPENYIYGLDMKQLKNRGNNMCVDRLIFWSDDCVESKFYPEPDTNAPQSTTFPAGKGAWYRGNTIYYTGKNNSFDIIFGNFVCASFYVLC